MHQRVWPFYSLFHVGFSNYFKPYHPSDNSKHYYIYFTGRLWKPGMEKVLFDYVGLQVLNRIFSLSHIEYTIQGSLSLCFSQKAKKEQETGVERLTSLLEILQQLLAKLSESPLLHTVFVTLLFK